MTEGNTLIFKAIKYLDTYSKAVFYSIIIFFTNL